MRKIGEMMNRFNKILTGFITCILISMLMSVSIFAVDNFTISIGNSESFAGETVVVPISMVNAPDFFVSTIEIEYDEDLMTLLSVQDIGLVNGDEHSDKYSSPYTLTWVNNGESVCDGVVAELTFKLSNDVEEDLHISINIPRDGVIDNDGDVLEPQLDGGIIYIVEDHEHDYGRWTEYNSVKHMRECDCGEAEYERHSWDNGEVTEEPTEDTTGEMTYTCDECGAMKYEVIPELPSEEVSVDGVSLNKSSATITVGETLTLRATVTPSNATDRTVKWTSSDTTIASVTNGVVTGKKAGTATITVTTTDGNKTAKCTVTVNAAPVTDGIKLSMSEAFGATGQTITMDVLISDVPANGISSLDFSINYDSSQVELVEVPVDAGILGDSLFGNNYSSVPYRMTWNNLENYSPNGKLVTLTFKIKNMPSEGEIEIELIHNECSNINEDTFDVVTTNGIISNSIPGDVNEDGKVTQLDVTRLRKYLAGGWNVEINSEAADVNGDGKVTQLDVTRLRKYLAGGWNVTLE